MKRAPVSIYKVLVSDHYPISQETAWKYHHFRRGHDPSTPKALHEREYLIKVYPRLVEVDTGSSTEVVWVNDTDKNVTLKHDVIRRSRGGNDPVIEPREEFRFTFEPGGPAEHPSGSLYYTVGPNNQPGETKGRP